MIWNKTVIVRLICSYLSIIEVGSFSLVSKQFNKIMNDKLFWSLKFKLDFEHLDEPKNSKNFFKSIHTQKIFMMGLDKENLLKVSRGDFIERFIQFDPKNIRNIKSVNSNNYGITFLNFKGEVFKTGYGLDLGYSEFPNKINIPTKIKLISCGFDHTFLLDQENSLFSYGFNYYGQLGLNFDEKVVTFPTRIKNIKAKSVNCGDEITFIINLEDEILSCGNNLYGSLCTGDFDNRSYLTKIEGIKVKSLCCSPLHVLAIDQEDNILSCGYNSHGQLGTCNKYENINKFYKIDGIKAKKIGCGENTSYIVDKENNLWVCGDNSYGQLGLGNKKIIMRFTKVDSLKVKSIYCSYDSCIVKNIEGKFLLSGNIFYHTDYIDKNKIFYLKKKKFKKEKSEEGKFKKEKFKKGKFNLINIEEIDKIKKFFIGKGFVMIFKN